LNSFHFRGVSNSDRVNNNNNNNNIPLTHELNRSKCGYQVYGTERKINHLLYMDDLKLIGRSEEELRNKIKIVKTFSDDIKMKFGLKNVLEFL
jgi:hypothetical protein